MGETSEVNVAFDVYSKTMSNKNYTETMRNYHVIFVKYLGWTETRPARISIYSHRFDSRKIISRNSVGDFTFYQDEAVEYLKQQGFKVIGQGNVQGGISLITDTFQPIS